jgi:hypothetical protein
MAKKAKKKSKQEVTTPAPETLRRMEQSLQARLVNAEKSKSRDERRDARREERQLVTPPQPKPAVSTAALFHTNAAYDESDASTVRALSQMMSIVRDPMTDGYVATPVNPNTPLGYQPFRLRQVGEFQKIPLTASGATIVMDLMARYERSQIEVYYTDDTGGATGAPEVLYLNTRTLKAYEDVQFFQAYAYFQGTSAAFTGHGSATVANVDRTAVGINPQYLDLTTARSYETAYASGTAQVRWDETIHVRQLRLDATMVPRLDVEALSAVATGALPSDTYGVQNAGPRGHVVKVQYGANQGGSYGVQDDPAWIGYHAPNTSNPGASYSRVGRGWHVNTQMAYDGVDYFPACEMGGLEQLNSAVPTPGTIFTSSGTVPAGVLSTTNDWPVSPGLIAYVDLTGGLMSTAVFTGNTPGPTLPVFADYHVVKFSGSYLPSTLAGTSGYHEIAFVLWGMRGWYDQVENAGPGWSAECLGIRKSLNVVAGGGTNHTSAVQFEVEFLVTRPDTMFDSLQLGVYGGDYTDPNNLVNNGIQINSITRTTESVFANPELLTVPVPIVFLPLGTDYPGVRWGSSIIGNAMISLSDDDIAGFVARTGLRDPSQIPDSTLLEPLRVLSNSLPISMSDALFEQSGKFARHFGGDLELEKAGEMVPPVLRDHAQVAKTQALFGLPIAPVLTKLAHSGGRLMRSVSEGLNEVAPDSTAARVGRTAIGALDAWMKPRKAKKTKAAAADIPADELRRWLAELGSPDWEIVRHDPEPEVEHVAVKADAFGYVPFPVVIAGDEPGEYASVGTRTLITSFTRPEFVDAEGKSVADAMPNMTGFVRFNLAGFDVHFADSLSVARRFHVYASDVHGAHEKVPEVGELDPSFLGDYTQFFAFLQCVERLLVAIEHPSKWPTNRKKIYVTPATGDIVDSVSWLAAAALALAGVKTSDVAFTGPIRCRQGDVTRSVRDVRFTILPMAKEIMDVKDNVPLIASTTGKCISVFISVRPGMNSQPVLHVNYGIPVPMLAGRQKVREEMQKVVRTNYSTAAKIFPVLSVYSRPDWSAAAAAAGSA